MKHLLDYCYKLYKKHINNVNKYFYIIRIYKNRCFAHDGLVIYCNEYDYKLYYKNIPRMPKIEFYYTICNDIVKPINFKLSYFTNKVLCRHINLEYNHIYPGFIYIQYYTNKQLLYKQISYKYNVANLYFSIYNLYMIIYYFIAPNEHKTEYLYHSIHKRKELNLCINYHIMNYINIY